jgi:hypothetical protein
VPIDLTIGTLNVTVDGNRYLEKWPSSCAALVPATLVPLAIGGELSVALGVISTVSAVIILEEGFAVAK